MITFIPCIDGLIKIGYESDDERSSIISNLIDNGMMYIKGDNSYMVNKIDLPVLKNCFPKAKYVNC